ncbi:MAG: methionine--tRNA ligase [Actinobacteria bacterium]|nr:methionine--tRNA ligase [Actinomycetota bacterium]
MESTYLTVAIPYVNADPHLGYAYELVQADIYARSRRGAGDHVRFLGGTDDYSLKNVIAAEAAGEATRDFVDRHADRFEALHGPLRLSFDDFIRTSRDPRHAPAVERLWRSAAARGDLYKRHYQGDYCIGCEQFYEESQLLEGRCPEHGTPTERVAEENWFFRLSSYQEHLDELVSSGRLAVRPEPFRREVLSFIRSGLADVSVSRSRERARGWGLTVPGDPTQVIYVWFDALTNYISALRFGEDGSAAYRQWWLESDRRVHLIGKGILRFHAVYWPAFLEAAGQPAPTRIQVHPYLTVDGQKLSKSQGGGVRPTELVDAYGADALRWWFAREVAEITDTDFTVGRLIDRANEDLANALGNTASRIATLVHRNLGGRIDARLVQPPDACTALEREVTAAISDFRLRDAARLITDATAALNADLTITEPWRLAADPANHEDLERVLGRQLGAARSIAAAAGPIIPDLSQQLRARLGDGNDELPAPSPAFKRLAPADR